MFGRKRRKARREREAVEALEAGGAHLPTPEAERPGPDEPPPAPLRSLLTDGERLGFEPELAIPDDDDDSPS